MTIKTILSLAAALTLAAQFFGCSNLSGGSVTNGAGGPNAASGGQNGAGQDGSQETVLITVSGSIDFDGAFPEEVAALVGNSLSASAEQDGLDGLARSAFPGVPSSSGLAYEVYAEEVTTSATKLSYYGTAAADGKSYTIGIPVCNSKKYAVTITAKQDGIAILSGTGEIPQVRYTTDTFKTNINITLKAARTDTGVGMVDLPVDVSDAGVASARALYTDPSDGTQKTIAGALGSGGIMTFSQGEVKTNATTGQKYIDGGLKTGAYLMTFEFYSAASYGGKLLYSFKEPVNVFDNMATNNWVQNSGEPWLAPDASGNTSCKITAALVQGYGLTDIYVDPSAADDSGSGAFYAPKKTFAAAVAMLRDDAKNYTIHINGTVAETATSTIAHRIPSSISARSLTIQGVNPPDGDGVPTDALSGGGSRETLYIAKTVPVTIKNLMITGGKAEKGGGIRADIYNCVLTLAEGAYITGNEATSPTLGGGGVYFDGKELIMLEGAVIKGNYASGNSDADKGAGGGVYLCSGKSFTMNDGVIIGNHAVGNGGGVYVKSGTFTMAGGVIGDDSKNEPSSSTGNSSNYAANGGGVYLCGGTATVDSYFYFTGGTIAYNMGVYGGGGIYAKYCDATIRGVIKCNGTYVASASGGGIYADEKSTIRLENCSILKNKTDNYNPSSNNKNGGAIYVKNNSTISNAAVVSLKGSVSIPCTGINENDVYLPSVKIAAAGVVDSYPLTIAGKLTGTGTVATITPGGNGSTLIGYDEAIQVLQLASGVTDTSIAEAACMFAVTPNGSENWAVGFDGKMIKPTIVTSSNVGDLIFNNNDYVLQLDSSMNIDDSVGNSYKVLMGKLDLIDSPGKIVLDLSNAGDIFSGVSYSVDISKNISVVVMPWDATEFSPRCFKSGSYSTSMKLKEIIVPGGSNDYFCSEDGVLYNKGKTKILRYPPAKTDANFMLPSTVTTLEEGVFYGCTYITRVTNLSQIKTTSGYLNEFFNCTALTTADLSGFTDTTLTTNFFADCTSLRTVYLSSKITKLGTTCFRNCRALEEIRFASPTPPQIRSDSFQSCPSSMSEQLTFYVPAGSQSAYLTATEPSSGTYRGFASSYNPWASSLSSMIIEEE